MSSQLIDPATYPISKVTARHLGRPLFGHVIDGEVVASLDGATMPVDRSGHGSAGRDRGGGVAGGR